MFTKQNTQMNRWILVGLILLYGWYLWSNIFSSKDDKEEFNNSAIDTTPRRVLFGDVEGNITTRLFSDMYIPQKTIVMWFNNEIPPGWAECNGENGTPDLRERFPIALDSAKDAKANRVGATGGIDQVILETQHLPSHAHPALTDSAGWGATSKEASAGVATYPDSTGSHTHNFTVEYAGGTDTSCNSDADCTRINTAYRCSKETRTCIRPHNNIPPYYVLKFIMKL